MVDSTNNCKEMTHISGQPQTVMDNNISGTPQILN